METKKFKILIIEDEKALANVLEKKLLYEGYEVSVACNGQDGMNKVKSTNPDLILLDIVMPKMNGFEVLENLKKDKKFSSIPVIVLSNSGYSIDLNKALDLGAIDYLVKAEFDLDEVIKKIEETIGNENFSKKELKNEEKENFSQNNNSHKKILIVEDDKFLRDLCLKKLKKTGFKVLTAFDGKEGLKKIKEEKPALILLDIVLPGLSGFEVLKQIKADSQTSSIPVIILSNLGQKEDIEKGIKLGAKDYIIKADNTPNEIIEKVKTVMLEKV
jgi:two-component system phosphate regulon response regulator PhoB/two-component system alkaline phosphatase synthesis response regulator PhoP